MLVNVVKAKNVSDDDKVLGKIHRKSFTTPHTRRFADYAKKIVRFHTCVDNLFIEDHNERFIFLLSSLEQEDKGSELVETAFILQEDERTRGMLLKYVWFCLLTSIHEPC